MRIAADGGVPIEIRSGSMSLMERLNRPVRLSNGFGIAEQSLLLTQLALLVRSGLPLDRSVDLLRDQASRAAQRDLLGQVLLVIRSGRGFAHGLEQHRILPDYAIGVIRSAEQSGKLGEALTALAQRMSAVAATRRQLVTALTYPAAVLAATFVALLLVLLLVVPQFEPIFAGQQEKLPPLTRLVLALSAAVRSDGPLLAAVLTLSGVGALLFLRSAAGRAMMHRLNGRLPRLALYDLYLAAQFTGLLGTLVANGVQLIRALPMAASALRSRTWRRHIAAVEQRVREGSTLSAALLAISHVPSTAIRLIEVGERSGRLADTCSRASEVMGDAARARIDRIVSLVNPIAIVTLGGLVAVLVAGVMLGIFALGDFAG